MAISIKNEDVDRLMNKLRELTGQGPTEIIKSALEREYQELRRQRRQALLAEQLPEIQEVAQQKAHDFVPDSLYDKNGLPG